MKWLQSGRRRDICYLLARESDLRGQECKSRLETHYDDRISPTSFYGSLSALVDAGFVDERTEGLHDVYSLAEAGERRVEAHARWVSACTDEMRAGSPTDDTRGED